MSLRYNILRKRIPPMGELNENIFDYAVGNSLHLSICANFDIALVPYRWDCLNCSDGQKTIAALATMILVMDYQRNRLYAHLLILLLTW